MSSLPKVSTMPVVNTSGLEPLGHAVLVQPIRTELYSKTIVIPETVAERSIMVETVVRIIAVGPQAWSKYSSPWAKVGDKVMISKWTGHLCVGPKDGKQYRMVNQEDIFCKIEENLDVN